MSEITGAEPTQGSIEGGHVRQAALTLHERIDEAWRLYSQHIRKCQICRGGVDCTDAVGLHAAWRELVPRV